MKIIIRLLALTICVLMLTLNLGCAVVFGADEIKSAGRTIELDLTSATVTLSSDSHGGFHGDGIRFLNLDCGGTHVREQIENCAHWKPLPLSTHVSTLLYGGEGWTPIVTNNDPDSDVYGQPLFPTVKNGWYFFYDRYDNGVSFDRYDDSLVLGRNSFNFTVALYDAETDTLYFSEMDT